jgi:phenylalanyl-tRNA synthetase alpha chain
MAEDLQQIERLAEEAEAELRRVKNAPELEQFRIKYLGSKGSVKNLMNLLGQAPPDQKRAVGQRVNAVKARISSAFEAHKQALAAGADVDRDAVDVTEPGRPIRIGGRHILIKVTDELTELFGRMGFAVASGPEVEDEFHNFVALNIPESHPARDPLDNFYLMSGNPVEAIGHGDGEKGRRGEEEPSAGDPASPRLRVTASSAPSAPSASPLLLRTQTSTVQIRVMQETQPPIRVVIPGRVYRPDTTDQTHLPMFHQLEALVVDRNVTMVDLKSTVMQFVHAYFGPQTRVRFRPSFFPFTEPSAEVDVFFEDRGKWIELGGCGMVHPSVFRNCGIDPEEFSGWAFGFGIERIAMRKYGITDIRYFVENDIRFLRQF